MHPQDFWRLYREVYRRRRLVLAVGGACLGVVALGCIVMPRYYRASAYVMPSEAALRRPIIPGAGLPLDAADRSWAASASGKADILASLIGLARTGEVRQRAIGSLGLHIPAAEMEEFVKVESSSGSIIRITALSRTREGAVALANAIAHHFCGYYQDLTSRQARRNQEFLERELAAADTQRQQAKADLQKFKTEQGEAVLPTGTAGNPFLAQFYSLRSEMDANSSQLRAVEGRLRSVRAELARQAPTREVETSTTNQPLTQELEDELARLERELLVAQARYTEKHKKVKDLKAQIAGARERLARVADRMITHRTVAPNPVHRKLQDQILELEAESAGLRSRHASLLKAMAENERRAAKLADTSVLLIAKTREYDNAQARYERLTAMLDEATVAAKVSAESGEVQVVDQAKAAIGPVTKSGPSPAQLMLLGIVLSGGAALGMVLLLAFLDDRLREREDLLRELQVPVPAVIPQLSDGKGEFPLARVTELRPLSPHAEAYRFLRTEILHRNGKIPLRTLLVATARPGQGGTTTAVNLAISLAEVGERVVLVDADLRRPGLHLFFGEHNDAGLTTLLVDGSANSAEVLRQTGVERLLLLPAGPAVPNPASLLASPRLRKLLARLSEHADYIVIDTPSAATFSDAAMVAPLVDGVILVTRANQPVREVERRTKQLLEKVGANVIGAVLNDASTESVDSHYFHRHYYPDRPALPPGDDGPAGRQTPAQSRADEGASRSQDLGQQVQVSTPASGDADARRNPTDRHPPPSRSRAETRPPHPVRRGRPLVAKVAALLAVLAAACGYALYRPAAPGMGAAGGAVPASDPHTPAVRVTVEAVVRQQTDVRVERDGELLYEGPLAAGQQVWQAAREIRLWASRPAAIEVTVNGEPMGVLGSEGDPPVSRRFAAE